MPSGEGGNHPILGVLTYPDHTPEQIRRPRKQVALRNRYNHGGLLERARDPRAGLF